MDIITRIEAGFEKLPIRKTIRDEWQARAQKIGSEHLDAYLALSVYQWWEAPASLLFADYAGLIFLPDEVFSYFSPGCMIQSFKANQGMGAFDKVLFRVAYPTYRFQNLNMREIIIFGSYLDELTNHPQVADTGSLNISLQKINDCKKLNSTSNHSKGIATEN